MSQPDRRQTLGMLAATSLFAVACATSSPYQQPVPAAPISLGQGEELAVDRVVVLFDASGSIDAKKEFPGEKAWVESFVQGMPDGRYYAQIRSFGGDTRRGDRLAPFDREQTAATANDLRYIGEDTPLDAALLEIADEIDGAGGRTAVIVVSDGIANPPTWGGPEEPALEAARTVAERSQGIVCFHTVLAGSDDEGRMLLESISAVTPCGSFRPSASISDSPQIVAFERDVFVTDVSALPAVAAARPADIDRDGVLDVDDACPGTPAGASVDERGCLILPGIRFGSNSAEVVVGSSAAVQSVVTVLRQNPDMRIRIEGYTDSTGSAAYNEQLSRRRAEVVKRAIVADGIDPARLDTAGLGEADPIADNATPAGRAQNRRIEFEVER